MPLGMMFRPNVRLKTAAWSLLILVCACTGEIGKSKVSAGSDGIGGQGSDDDGSGGRGSANSGGISEPPRISTCMQDAPAPRKLWRLTTAQLERTYADLLPASTGITKDFSAVSDYPNRAETLALGDLRVDETFEAVYNAAHKASLDPGRLHSCLAVKLDDSNCIRTFLTGFGRRAFRRPLTDEELGRYTEFHASRLKATDGKRAIGDLIAAMMQSPFVLFRSELGAQPTGATTLTAHERAAALSYAVTDGPPDSELAAAADTNKLSAAQLSAHARRLIQKVGARALEQNLEQLLDLPAVARVSKDKAVYPTFNEALARDMAEEGRRFIADELQNGGGRIESLLAATHTFVTPRLAAVYGIAAPTSDWGKVQLQPNERAGILTMPGLMSRLARPGTTDIVRRGLFVRHALLCQDLPPPPPDIPPIPPAMAGETERQRVERHSTDARCASCHRLMDPLGAAFETLDGIGRYSPRGASGESIDATGDLTGTADHDGKINGPVELAKRLAKAPEVKNCLSSKVFEAMAGRELSDDDSCLLQNAQSSLTKDGGSLSEFLVNLLSDERFYVRR